MEEANKVLGCLQQANPKLVSFLELIEQESISFEAIKEFKDIVSDTAVEAWRPVCNCLIDICRNRNLHGRAHELLYLGTMFGLSPDLHNKTVDEWRSDVCALSLLVQHILHWKNGWKLWLDLFSAMSHFQKYSWLTLVQELSSSPTDYPAPLPPM